MSSSDKEKTPPGNVPPPLSQRIPPDLEMAAEPQSGPSVTKKSEDPNGLKKFLVIVLSLALGLFLADAIICLIDDSLIVFLGTTSFSGIRGIIGFLTLLASFGIYLLIGITPMVPKRIFLPLALFQVVTTLILCQLAIYYFSHLEQIALVFSIAQVLLGIGLIAFAQGSFKFRWPLLPAERLNEQRFSWLNSGAFVLINIFVLVPALVIYVFVCSSLAVSHFTDGFMALHPSGFSVQVRKYMRNDGKMIELFPMAHVADAGFYQRVEQTFPTNSVILMEGVTDSQNLLTNKISYARMAKALGLSEQHQAFEPTRGKMVRADVDVDQFSTDTIQLLNLVMLIHTKGTTPANIAKLLEYSPSPKIKDELMDDLLRNRNEHLITEIKSYLKKSNHIMVPWGVAHMPGISKAIQDMGFQLVDSQDYMVIRFHGHEK